MVVLKFILNDFYCKSRFKINLKKLNSVFLVAMTDYPAPSSFLKPMPGYPMKEICKFLTTDQLDDINLVKSFKNAIYSIYLNYTGTAPTCINLNSDSTDLGAEGWYYQTCTEAVMPICSDGKDDFFEPDPFNLTEVEIDCKNFFNVSIDPYKVRMEYSLHDLRAATNVVFSNGDRDPWSCMFNLFIIINLISIEFNLLLIELSL